MNDFSAKTRCALLAGTLMLPCAADAAAQTPPKTVRVIVQAALKSADPVFSAAYVTRDHGYAVFDTLFAMDAEFKVRPQMAESYAASADGLSYTVTLREGLRFHDGAPVTPADCIASIARWGRADALGKKLLAAIERMEQAGDRAFRIALKQRFPFLIEALGKPGGIVPFIMPARVAATPADREIAEAIGSGPFRFLASEWKKGERAVYARFDGYVPRPERPSLAAGGKSARLDRVEFVYIPDDATAAFYLNTGEIDMWERPPAEMLPRLTGNPDIAVVHPDRLGMIAVLRFNHRQPPFDDPKLRQAVRHAADQGEYLAAMMGAYGIGRPCAGFLACGSPWAEEAGAEAPKAHDLDKARALVRESGYAGERIVVLSPIDQRLMQAQAEVTAQVLRRLGMNVELVHTDWAGLTKRRESAAPADRGGWSIFHTLWPGVDMLDPVSNGALGADGERAWYGWPRDDAIEALRRAWLGAASDAERKQLAAKLQEAAIAALPYLPLGQYLPPLAHRTSLTGLVPGPSLFLWNLDKK